MRNRNDKAALLVLSGLLTVVLFSGCSTTAMKGTPFYTGEYAKRNGPAEQRINAWPVFYYRDPAMSVLWPLLEHSDDHFAIRPLFSEYNLQTTNHQYNVLWPLCQFDRQTGDNRVFPIFWGRDHFVAFPAYWHFDHPFQASGGTDSLFPLWLYDRTSTRSSLYCAWPLYRQWSDTSTGEHGRMVLPLFYYDGESNKSTFLSPVWMQGTAGVGNQWRLLPGVFYQSASPGGSAFVTPFWAQGRSAERDWKSAALLCYWDSRQRTLLSPLWATWNSADAQCWLVPGALTWGKSEPGRKDVWAAAGLAHASWGTNAGANHFIPFYYRDREERLLLTPITGWRATNDGFIYPLTPVAGAYTGTQHGGWLFPVFSHCYNTKSTNTEDRWLLLAGRTKSIHKNEAWAFPIFSYENHGQQDVSNTNALAMSGTKFKCLPAFWHENTLRRTKPVDHVFDSGLQQGRYQPTTQTTIEHRQKNGLFPLWSYSSRTSLTDSHGETNVSVGMILYDYKHRTRAKKPTDSDKAEDYTRTRILWRLWHYEKSNGDISIDIFPAITSDRKTDGYRKISFIGRLFRYEKNADHKTNIDVLFIPIRRTSE